MRPHFKRRVAIGENATERISVNEEVSAVHFHMHGAFDRLGEVERMLTLHPV